MFLVMSSSMSSDRILKKAAEEVVRKKGSWFQQLMQCVAEIGWEGLCSKGVEGVSLGELIN